LTTRVEDQSLLVRFGDGATRTWNLPSREDKSAIRSIRNEAVGFAREHGATLGQENAIKKALTSAGYHLTR
jgi:hypothetical protein